MYHHLVSVWVWPRPMLCASLADVLCLSVGGQHLQCLDMHSINTLITTENCCFLLKVWFLYHRQSFLYTVAIHKNWEQFLHVMYQDYIVFYAILWLWICDRIIISKTRMVIHCVDKGLRLEARAIFDEDFVRIIISKNSTSVAVSQVKILQTRWVQGMVGSLTPATWEVRGKRHTVRTRKIVLMATSLLESWRISKSSNNK